MKTLNEIISILKEYKKTMSSQYGIKRLGVFGSVARGEQTESSDLDICVEIETPNFYILCDIQEDLEKLTGYKIDLLRLRQNLNELLMNNIRRDICLTKKYCKSFIEFNLQLKRSYAEINRSFP